MGFILGVFAYLMLVDVGKHIYIVNMAKVATRKTAGKKKATILSKIRRLSEKVPASELAKIPADGSVNYKHYLYGLSKK